MLDDKEGASHPRNLHLWDLELSYTMPELLGEIMPRPKSIWRRMADRIMMYFRIGRFR